MSRNSPKEKPRYEALLLLLRTAEQLWNGSQKFFAKWEISSSQFNILNLLHGQPDGLTQIELSRQLIMHRSNVTGLVDRLEKRKLLIRKANKNDRRVYLIVLTPAGRKLIEQILPDYYQAAEEIWGTLALPRIKQLKTDFQTLSQNIETFSGKHSK